jgi:hypothetical protein
MFKFFKFLRWKKDCAIIANKMLGLWDFGDSDNPYGLFSEMQKAFNFGYTPEEFIYINFAREIKEHREDQLSDI